MAVAEHSESFSDEPIASFARKPREVADPLAPPQALSAKSSTSAKTDKQLAELRKELDSLMADQVATPDCVVRICRRLKQIQREVSEIHRFEIDSRSEKDREQYLASLSAAELASLMITLESEIAKFERESKGPLATAYRDRIAKLSGLRDEVEKALYPEALAGLRKQYREREKKITDALPTATEAEKKKLRLEKSEIFEKKQLFDMIKVSELAALKEEEAKYGVNDLRAGKYIRENSDVIKQAYDSVADRLPTRRLKDMFKAEFEPRVRFGEDGQPEIFFVPSVALRKKQAEQRIAASTSEAGNQDDLGIYRLRKENLTLPKNPNEALLQMVALERNRSQSPTARDLIDRSGVRSGGIQATGDETAVITLAASGLARGAATTLSRLGVRGSINVAAKGAAFGGGLDVVQQGAENLDRYRKGEQLVSYSPTRTVQAAGTGAVLAPLAVGNPAILKGLGVAGIADGGIRALNGDYASAIVSAGGGALAFRKPKAPLGDAAAADLHLQVKRASNGDVIVDTEHPSFRYIEGFVEAVNDKNNRVGKIVLNGDYIDAPSLKAVGANDPVTKAKVIAEVVNYIKTKTGREVEVGIGNHDGTKNLTTNRYDGVEVAKLLETEGIRTFATNDLMTAKIPLSGRAADGSKVFVEYGHKVTNYGPNLEAMLPNSTKSRILPDVELMSNPQAEAKVAAKITSDIHQALLIRTSHTKAGTDTFLYGNTGAVNGKVNSGLTSTAGGAAEEAGTFFIVRPTARGNASVQMYKITPDGNGKLTTSKLQAGEYMTSPDPKSPTELYPTHRVGQGTKTIPADVETFGDDLLLPVGTLSGRGDR